MINRDIEATLQNEAKFYPVIAVTGPRQSGKTTVVKKIFQDKPYVNLEKPNERLFAREDPEVFFAKYPDGAIIDEIQREPSLLSYMQVIVDQKQQKGMFIITGSHQTLLHQEISQSLAGRVSLLRLLPLSMTELSNAQIKQDVDSLLFRGFYPAIYNDNLNPTKAYQNYLETYVEKDIRQLINVKDLFLFEKFLRLCAGRIGQVFVSSNLADEVGVSYHTINNWLSILEASFLVFRLQPYFENVGKRCIKSPKLYFSDVGFASFLLNIEKESEIARDPLRGALFENMVILELVKTRINQGLLPNLYFYRDPQRNEIDVLLKMGASLVAIEIKSAQTYNSSLLKGLDKFKDIAKNRIKRSYLVYAGELEQRNKDVEIMNYKNVSSIIKA
jgi:predicted AAA+ superfamily ATPase